MSSLFGASLRAKEKREEAMTSTRHEPVYHATHGCQAASLSLTAARWRGLKRACQVERQKHARFLPPVEDDQHPLEALRSFTCMLVLRLLKGGSLITLSMEPQREDDPDPDVGKRTDSHGMAFAFGALALVVVPGPRLTLRTLPGELMQGIAQRFDAPQSAMRFGVHPALIQHGRGASQRLQTASILV